MASPRAVLVPCYLTITSPLTGWTYNNGSLGVGATLTAPVAGLFSADGFTPTSPARILVQGQTNPAWNGIYAIKQNSASIIAVLTRTTDYDEASQINVNDQVNVTDGDVYGNTWWNQTQVVHTMGTDPIEFIQTPEPVDYPLAMALGGTGANLTPALGSLLVCGISAVGLLATLANGILATNASGIPSITQTLPVAVQSNITQVGLLPSIDITGSTITTSGNQNVNFNFTGPTNVTYPTSGTLATLSDVINSIVGTPGQITATTVSEVTTIGIDPIYAGQTSISKLGTITTGQWNGSLIPMAFGGTNANLTATANSLVYSTASAMALLPSANNGTLITSSAGVPSISSTLPLTVQLNITEVGTINTGVWQGTQIGAQYGGTGIGEPSPGQMLVGSATIGQWAFLAAPGFEQILSSDATGAVLWSNSLPGAVQSTITISESQVTNLTTDLAARLQLSGGTMTGLLVLSGDPTSAMGAVTKQYADAISAGLDIKAACYAATTGSDLGYTYANGSSGVGATLTAPSTGVFTTDGTTPPIGSRILVKDETTAAWNGIYSVTTSSSGSAAVLTRTTDYNTISEIQPGNLIVVDNGTINSGTGWIQTQTVTTIGTSSIAFSPFNLMQAGAGLTRTGNTISLSTPVTLANGGTNAGLTANNGGIVWSNATQMQILAGTATANKILMSGATAAPSWSSAIYPATTTINQLLFSSAANTITGLATGNNGILVTSAAGVPSISSTLPSTVQTNITTLGTITTQVNIQTLGNINTPLVVGNANVSANTSYADFQVNGVTQAYFGYGLTYGISIFNSATGNPWLYNNFVDKQVLTFNNTLDNGSGNMKVTGGATISQANQQPLIINNTTASATSTLMQIQVDAVGKINFGWANNGASGIGLYNISASKLWLYDAGSNSVHTFNNTLDNGSGAMSAVSLSLTNPLPIASGGSGTATPSLVAGTGVSITGSWPNQTITATGANLVAGTNISISGNTISVINNPTFSGLVTANGNITCNSNSSFDGNDGGSFPIRLFSTVTTTKELFLGYDSTNDCGFIYAIQDSIVAKPVVIGNIVKTGPSTGPRNILDDGSGAATFAGLVTANAGVTTATINAPSSSSITLNVGSGQLNYNSTNTNVNFIMQQSGTTVGYLHYNITNGMALLNGAGTTIFNQKTGGSSDQSLQSAHNILDDGGGNFIGQTDNTFLTQDTAAARVGLVKKSGSVGGFGSVGSNTINFYNFPTISAFTTAGISGNTPNVIFSIAANGAVSSPRNVLDDGAGGCSLGTTGSNAVGLGISAFFGTVTIGNSSGSPTINILAGSGAISIAASGSSPLAIGNASLSSFTVNIAGSNNGINITQNAAGGGYGISLTPNSTASNYRTAIQFGAGTVNNWEIGTDSNANKTPDFYLYDKSSSNYGFKVSNVSVITANGYGINTFNLVAGTNSPNIYSIYCAATLSATATLNLPQGNYHCCVLNQGGGSFSVTINAPSGYTFTGGATSLNCSSGQAFQLYVCGQINLVSKILA